MSKDLLYRLVSFCLSQSLPRMPFSDVVMPRLTRRCLDVFLHCFQLLVKRLVKPWQTDAARVRHLALGSMIQATADQKARTADNTKDQKSRTTGQLLELQTGDLVDFFRKPISKDSTGWHGPAQIVDLSSLRDGIGPYQMARRVLSARVQDIRSALTFATFLMQPSNPIRLFCAEVEAHQGHLMRVGWVKQGRTWIECKVTKKTLHFCL